LVSDLVDVASIDAGRLAVNASSGNVSALIAEVADEFRASAAVKGIELRIESDTTVLLGMFDHARLFQVLGNLMSNAIKFSPRGSTIVLRGERHGDELQCSISDQGPGIPVDQLETVFDRFAQVQHHDRRGLGLGLFIAKRIVEGHAGRIWAESTPGHGTTVRFTFPLQPTS
jgi:signal transduction histidine kinase